MNGFARLVPGFVLVLIAVLASILLAAPCAPAQDAQAPEILPRWALPAWGIAAPAGTAPVELLGYGYMAVEGVTDRPPGHKYVEDVERVWVDRTAVNIVVRGDTRFGIDVRIGAGPGQLVQCTDRLISPDRLDDGRVVIKDETLTERHYGPHCKTSYFVVEQEDPVPEGEYTYIYECGENQVRKTFHVAYAR